MAVIEVFGNGFILSPSSRQSTPTVPTAPFTLALTSNYIAPVDGNVSLAVAPPGGQDFLLSDGGAGGTFSPSSVTIAEGQSQATFTYSHPSVGTQTISAAPDGGSLAGQSPQSATVTIGATSSPTLESGSGGASSMSAIKKKKGAIFNLGYLSAIDANGKEIVFGVLQKFGFKSNMGLKELMDPDALVAAGVGASERKITVTAAQAIIKLEQFVLAMGGSTGSVAAITDPVTAPTLTAAAGPTALTAGWIAVGYAWRSPNGATKISTLQPVQLTSTQKATVASLALPTGTTIIDLFVSAQSHATSATALAAPVYQLGSIAGGAAYDITEYASANGNIPKTVSEIGIAQDSYLMSVDSEPVACTLQWKAKKNGGSINMVAYGVIFPDFEMNGDMREWIIPNLSGNVYGDENTGKVIEILIPK